MPESQIGLTEGAGKNAHTFQRVIGANTVEDDVVIVGEQYLASYTINTIHNAVVSTATANSHLLQIMAGASLKVRIRRIEIYQNAVATAVALLDVRLYRLTTAGTGGTAIQCSPYDTTDAASGLNAMTLPTVKGTESTPMDTGSAYMMQTLAASAQLNEPVLVFDYDRLRSKSLMIAAGATNGIAIKNINGIAGGTVTIRVVVDESNF